jgi:hypothetical protein
MHFRRSDTLAIIGTTASSILSAYAWLYSIGLVPLFTFVTGAFFTLWTQERFENKRRKQEFDKKMTESVYGPLHQELSSFLKDLNDFQSSMNPTNRISTLASLAKDYRYGFSKKGILQGVEELRNRLLPYATLYNEARDRVQSFILQTLDKNQIKRSVLFSIHDNQNREVHSAIQIIEPIFRDKTPMQFLNELPIPYMNISAKVHFMYPQDIGGPLSQEHKIELISKNILEEVRKDPVVQEQRREREFLIEKCCSLLELIKKEITLS